MFGFERRSRCIVIVWSGVGRYTTADILNATNCRDRGSTELGVEIRRAPWSTEACTIYPSPGYFNGTETKQWSTCLCPTNELFIIWRIWM